MFNDSECPRVRYDYIDQDSGVKLLATRFIVLTSNKNIMRHQDSKVILGYRTKSHLGVTLLK